MRNLSWIKMRKCQSGCTRSFTIKNGSDLCNIFSDFETKSSYESLPDENT